MDKTLDALFALGTEERIRLAQALWDSVAADSSYRPVLTDREKAEIDRRLATHRADPSNAIPAEEFMEELECRYG
jgi:putative addiction module component (TIGR02574 family)